MKKTILCLFILSAFYGTGQNLFQDSFGLYNTGVQLSGQGPWTNNSSLAGGLGSAVIGSGGSNVLVVATPISYLNYGSSTKSIEIKPNGDGCGLGFTPTISGDLFVSFVLNLSASQANNNSDFFRVMSGDNFTTSFRLYATAAGGGFFIGTAKGANGNAIAFSPNAYGFNLDHLIVVKYAQFSGVSDDVVSVYIDPAYITGEPNFPTFSTNVGMDQSGSLDRLSFRQNWTNGMPTGRAGLTSVATTWNALSFLPLATTNFDASHQFLIGTENVKEGILSLASDFIKGNVILKIYATNGTLLHKANIAITKNFNDFEITPLRHAGFYIIELSDDSNNRYTQKIIVK